MESYRMLKLLRINCWIVGFLGFVVFISGCWLTYSGFYHPSQEEYENLKLKNKYIYEKNGTRFEFNGMYGPESLVVGCSFLIVFAGFVQFMNAVFLLSVRPVKKMMGHVGKYITVNSFVVVALVLSLIVSIVTDPARSYENPKFNKYALVILVHGKNAFAVVLGCDIVLLTFTLLLTSIFYRNVNLANLYV